MKFKPTKSMSAAELMSRLKSDPEWVRQNEEREALHRAKATQLNVELEPEEKPLLAELAVLGYRVQSVWDLVNSKTSYSAAIPVLLKYLQIARHPVLREGIARALTVREARGIAGPAILGELKQRGEESPNQARWALANALTVVADASMADEIETLIRDARYNDVRDPLKLAIKTHASK
jgi:hypothetical protein